MDRSFKIVAVTILVTFLGIICGSSAIAKNRPISLDWSSKLSSGKKTSKKYLNFATPAIVEDRVYVGTSGGYFYAIDLQRGKKLWETKLEGPILSRPLFLFRYLLITCDNKPLF